MASCPFESTFDNVPEIFVPTMESMYKLPYVAFVVVDSEYGNCHDLSLLTSHVTNNHIDVCCINE